MFSVLWNAFRFVVFVLYFVSTQNPVHMNSNHILTHAQQPSMVAFFLLTNHVMPFGSYSETKQKRCTESGHSVIMGTSFNIHIFLDSRVWCTIRSGTPCTRYTDAVYRFNHSARIT